VDFDSVQLEVEEYGESSASPSTEEMPPSWSFRCGGREVLKVVEASDELCDESVGSSSPDDDECGVDYGRYKLEHELRSTEEALVSVMTESRCILPQLSASDSEYGSGNSVDQPAHDDDSFEDAKSHQQLPPWPVLPPSEDIGVTYRKKSKQWEAHLWLKRSKLQYCKKRGAQLFLGSFKSKDEAKAAHDKAAIKLDVRETREGTPYPLNFSESTHAGYIARHCNWSIRDFVWKIRRLSRKFTTGKSGMKGVTVRKLKWTKDEYYEATISQRMDGGRKIAFDLGRFERADEAGKAYDRALLFLKGADPDCVTNFRPSRYSSAEVREVGIKLLQALYSR
jgi:hypothetical protein